MKKSIGKPCEGKLHARFDEGGADSSEMKLSCEVIIIKVLSGPTLLGHLKKYYRCIRSLEE